MPKRKTLTDAAVKRLMAAQGDEQTDYFDSTYPGLALRVSKHGRKSWTYFYRVGGKQRRMTFDIYPAMSVESAHEAWRKARDAVRSGKDPAGDGGGATDFEGVFKEWLQRDQALLRSHQGSYPSSPSVMPPRPLARWPKDSEASLICSMP